MKKLIKLLFLALVICTAAAKAADFKPDHKANLLQQERQVRNFNGVAVSGSITAMVKIGNEESVRLEGDAEAIAQLVTEVKGGILIIRTKTKWMDWNRKFNNTHITAYITAKRITSLTMSGSGSIAVENVLNTPELTTTLSGSGSIKVAANVKNFTAVIGGSGNINLSGSAVEANITIGGSGSFRGKTLVIENAATQISGSGAIYIQANRKLRAVISGSGSVYYSGNANVEKTIVGSGGVRKS